MGDEAQRIFNKKNLDKFIKAEFCKSLMEIKLNKIVS